MPGNKAREGEKGGGERNNDNGCVIKPSDFG